jgi:hypothetical protein
MSGADRARPVLEDRLIGAPARPVNAYQASAGRARPGQPAALSRSGTTLCMDAAP